MVFGLENRHATPSWSKVSPQSHRMSVELLVNRYRGYSYQWSPSPQFLRTRLAPRYPSEWKSPLAKSPGYRSTISRCQSASSIFLVCLRPGPCCGNRHGQCLEQLTTSVHPGLRTVMTLLSGRTATIALAHS